MLFSFSDSLRTCYCASDTEKLFPKLLCSKISNRAPSYTVLSTHHQTSLRNNTEMLAWSLDLNIEAMKLVINPDLYILGII